MFSHHTATGGSGGAASEPPSAGPPVLSGLQPRPVAIAAPLTPAAGALAAAAQALPIDAIPNAALRVLAAHLAAAPAVVAVCFGVTFIEDDQAASVPVCFVGGFFTRGIASALAVADTAARVVMAPNVSMLLRPQYRRLIQAAHVALTGQEATVEGLWRRSLADGLEATDPGQQRALARAIIAADGLVDNGTASPLYVATREAIEHAVREIDAARS